MRVWMNKKTGDLALVRRVWLEADLPLPDREHAVAFGAVSAWAFQNEHGVIFIFPPKVQDEFEDLGEL